MLVFAQGPGSWRVSESLLDPRPDTFKQLFSLLWFGRCLTHSVSRTRCLTISLISHARLTLGSRPPALPLLPYALSHHRYLTCGGSPSCSLMLSSRDSRPHAASPALVLSDVLSASHALCSSHALFSFQLSRPTLVVSQLKFSQKSSNAHLILLRGRIE